MHTNPLKQHYCFEHLAASCKSLWLLKFDALKLDLAAWVTLGWYARLSPSTLCCAEADLSTNYVLNIDQKHLIMLPAHKPVAKAKLAYTILPPSSHRTASQCLHSSTWASAGLLTEEGLKRDPRHASLQKQHLLASRLFWGWNCLSRALSEANLSESRRKMKAAEVQHQKTFKRVSTKEWSTLHGGSSAQWTFIQLKACTQGAFWKSCNHA